MRRVCCVCGKDLGEKPPYDDPKITSTICGAECRRAFFETEDDEEPQDERKGRDV